MRQEQFVMPKSKNLKCLQRFLINQSGATALLTGLVAIPLMFAAGAAIDFARLGNAQTHMQVSLDTAAIAAASLKTKSDVERIETAKKVFAANISNGYAGNMSPSVTFQVVSGTIVARAEIEVPSAFMHLAGLDLMKGSTLSEVNILTDKKAEIALVLDYSYSMTESVGGAVKFETMRDAATKLVNDLEKSDPDKVKFGLVPFSHHVYTTLPASHVLTATSGTWTGCTQDRQSPYNVNDSSPTADDMTKWNQAMYAADKDQLKYGCKGYPANNLRMIDLTDKFDAITEQLEIMTPYAYTHIALGVEFGYHLLSPNAPFTKGVAYDDKETKKFMVVLTDGAQKTGGFGPTSRTVADGEKNLATLCENAKANGITMITMAFDLTDTLTVDRLRGCATDPARDFFIANDAVALANAFENIKNAITAEIVLKK
jgi:Flp pilus assembly protein TadG